jgi:hypothetical protein
MNEFQYRLSRNQKNEIAQNLIDILQKDAKIFDSTVTFISNWASTGHTGKRKAFFDVWDIVLKNYLPTTSYFARAQELVRTVKLQVLLED